MRKITLYRMINLILLLIYAGMLFSHVYFPIVPLSLSKIWCPLLLMIEGLMQIVKTIMFGYRTSLWFGLVLLLWGGVMMTIEIMQWPLISLIPACLFAISLVGFVIGFFYHDALQLGVGITILFVAIPFVFYTLQLIPLWATLLIAFVVFTICMVISRYIPERKGA